LPKHTIPGVGYQAYCIDPDGTIFGVHQRDESAS
jgi:predicted enzyme related to lactoylglutathione lyase